MPIDIVEGKNTFITQKKEMIKMEQELRPRKIAENYLISFFFHLCETIGYPLEAVHMDKSYVNDDKGNERVNNLCELVYYDGVTYGGEYSYDLTGRSIEVSLNPYMILPDDDEKVILMTFMDLKEIITIAKKKYMEKKNEAISDEKEQEKKVL